MTPFLDEYSRGCKYLLPIPILANTSSVTTRFDNAKGTHRDKAKRSVAETGRGLTCVVGAESYLPRACHAWQAFRSTMRCLLMRRPGEVSGEGTGRSILSPNNPARIHSCTCRQDYTDRWRSGAWGIYHLAYRPTRSGEIDK